MKELDVATWNRKEHFEFFKQFSDPYFGVTVDVNVTKAYQFAKKNNHSFFVLYLHACMKAINAVENFKYRIKEDKIVIHDVIHASATILRPNNTFGFSFIHFSEDFTVFNENFLAEKKRIFNSPHLFPPTNSEDCVYCSAMPWINFTGHKEPLAGFSVESVPKLAFSKFKKEKGALLMPVSIKVNHALMDGYHVGMFFEKFQVELDKIA